MSIKSGDGLRGRPAENSKARLAAVSGGQRIRGASGAQQAKAGWMG